MVIGAHQIASIHLCSFCSHATKQSHCGWIALLMSTSMPLIICQLAIRFFLSKRTFLHISIQSLRGLRTPVVGSAPGVRLKQLPGFPSQEVVDSCIRHRIPLRLHASSSAPSISLIGIINSALITCNQNWRVSLPEIAPHVPVVGRHLSFTFFDRMLKV